MGSLVFGLGFGCGSANEPEATKQLGPTERVVPDETADALSLERLSQWSSLPVFTTDRYRQYSSFDREVAPPTTLPLLANGNRDMNHFVCRSEDASMEPSLVDPVFDLETCPESYVHGLVLARAEGPGRLTRFQLTMLSLRGAPADDEMLRIYVDDDRPFLQVPLAAVLDGSAGEMFAPPFGRGSTQQLAWYYPVSFEKSLVIALDRVGALDLVYYQVDVAENPSHEAPLAERSELRDQAKTLLAEGSPPLLEELMPEATLSVAPGETHALATLPGPSTVHELSVGLSRSELPALDDITLSVSWDGATEPAIEVPLSFLYASSLAEPTESSLVLSASSSGDDVTLGFRLPMPFASSGSFALVSSASAPVSLRVSLRGEKTVPAVPFGRLHTEIHTTFGPTSDTHHPVFSAGGPGRYVGTCLMLEGHGFASGSLASPFTFLEGDFRGVIDGVLDLRDTGTEDYLNSSFYFETGPFSFAFAQAWGIEGDANGGRVSACRWHVLGDVIDYQTSFDLDLEIGPGEPSLLDRYRSIGFAYR